MSKGPFVEQTVFKYSMFSRCHGIWGVYLQGTEGL